MLPEVVAAAQPSRKWIEHVEATAQLALAVSVQRGTFTLPKLQLIPKEGLVAQQIQLVLIRACFSSACV